MVSGRGTPASFAPEATRSRLAHGTVARLCGDGRVGAGVGGRDPRAAWALTDGASRGREAAPVGDGAARAHVLGRGLLQGQRAGGPPRARPGPGARARLARPRPRPARRGSGAGMDAHPGSRAAPRRRGPGRPAPRHLGGAPAPLRRDPAGRRRDSRTLARARGPRSTPRAPACRRRGAGAWERRPGRRREGPHAGPAARARGRLRRARSSTATSTATTSSSGAGLIGSSTGRTPASRTPSSVF
jgi:hypothetical protein